MTAASKVPGFPDSFVWGAATSAFQIEGSLHADGAGPSDWSRFVAEPGRIRNGSTADPGCDHYRRWREDVDLLDWLGVNAYRLSLAWPRIQPRGTGAPNPRGLDFYSRLVDALLERGIEPFVTLHHWDLPAPLADAGGWRDAALPGRFAEYARIVFRALGDRVTWWSTINEPWVIAYAGWIGGVHPPLLREPASYPWVAHHLSLAHGEAVRAFRAEREGRIGPVVNIEPKYPASDSPEDVAATARVDATMNRLFLDPMLLGRYPDILRETYPGGWPDFPAAEMDTIRAPVDFVAVNYYTRAVVRADPAGLVGEAAVRVEGAAHTDMGWEIFPAGLTRTLEDLTERYGRVPLYITENGAALREPESLNGDHWEDPERTAYLRSHLGAIRRAMDHGADVRGYFVWSLLDNFEWALGTEKRFGLVHVDFATGRRTPKSSARFYRDVIGRRTD
ncbi:MAG: GH1 family beta-glucosidase [bacterium]